MYAPSIASWADSVRQWTTRLLQRNPSLRRIVSRDLAIDLGTANTVIYVEGQGIVLDEPSVVAVDVREDRIRAVGDAAKRMLGRTPSSIRAVRPLREGVIADFEVTEAMLQVFIARALHPRGIMRPRVVIAVPSGTTAVERRAVRQSAELAGARQVYLIEEAVAAAIGAGLPVEEARGSLVVDIGGGTTEVAVLALSGTVCARSTRIGGDALDQAIAIHMKRTHHLLIGASAAEELKLAIGSAARADEPRKYTVRGRDLVQGGPRGVEVASDEIHAALMDPLTAIANVVSEVLEATPPELAGDVIDSGMVLTGGGALLPGLDQMLSERTGLPVLIADEPLHAVAMGCGRCLTNLPLLRQLAKQPR